jgi:hypothetical protein
MDELLVSAMEELDALTPEAPALAPTYRMMLVQQENTAAFARAISGAGMSAEEFLATLDEIAKL